MRTHHYVTVGMFLCAFSLLVGGLDHWADAVKPQFVAGVALAIGTLLKAMNQDGPSTDASVLPSVTGGGESDMKVNWKQIGQLSLTIVGAVVPAVAQVELGVKAAVTAVKAHDGPGKQAAALEIVKASVALVEQASEKDLLNDPEVEAATTAIIDAVVALNNVLAKKAPTVG